MILAFDNNWPVVVANIWKTRKKWDRISRILGREDADAKTLGIFYKVMVQTVLMFGSEMWVMTPCTDKILVV